MRNPNFLAWGLFVLGAGVLGAYYVSTLPGAANAQEVTDGPGPNLVITVAGEANGEIVIDLLPDVAPQHVEQIVALANEGAYDNVVFHRVIDGFMAQTGDVEFGKSGGDTAMAGRGGSARPNIPAEFSDVPFDRGVVGMARSASPDSANSQFFIMFEPGYFLNGEYTAFGRVVSGMDVVDAIKRGDQAQNGVVTDSPDVMVSVRVEE
jgi:peptidylprolyl isomerase